MATSFIHYMEDDMDKGFWINDWFMELVAEYIRQVVEKHREHYPEWLLELSDDQLDLIRVGLMPGAIDLAIYEYLETTQHEDLFIEVLKKTKELLRSKGSEISDEELTSYEMQKLEELRRIPLRSKTLGRTQSTGALIQIIDEIIKMIVEKDNYNSEKHQPEFNFDLEKL
ncbi:hypothetical protein [Kordia jejudonensis]|uniref:hypothetical protein n=1 Tax=Kordia jejudonensis TaxID=1348245 RepID=UPI000629B682|nr:hypothetical protein [Kordia jejudonensis]